MFNYLFNRENFAAERPCAQQFGDHNFYFSYRVQVLSLA